MPFLSLSTYNFRNLKNDKIDLLSKEVYFVGENGQGKSNLLEALYYHFMKNFDELPIDYQNLVKVRGEKKESVVCDYIAGMTDQYAIHIYEDLHIPYVWKVV